MNLKISILFVVILIAVAGCSKDDITVIDDIGGPQFQLPKGEPGSVDEMIYNIHETYGTYVLYSFVKKDLTTLWTSKWNRWYIPADQSQDKKYIRKMIEMIEQSIFVKFEEKFIRDNFPYKILLTDTLFDDYEYDESKIVNLLSNGQNAIAIGNVGKKMDSWVENDWNKFSVELNNAFTLFYYSALPVKPVNFIGSRWTKIVFPRIKDPLGVDEEYNHSCWSVGYVAGSKGTTFMRPSEEADFGDFVAFLTGTPGSEIVRRLNKYSELRRRTLLLYPYLINVVHIDVVKTQNGNCPDDKLAVDFFDKLQ